ncbi:hypothetical protein KC950_02435 [Candidatus Saccharibacteria bacterium]|nr:hypothetical protein [Candidatus Saccharibacteria bacterium]
MKIKLLLLAISLIAGMLVGFSIGEVAAQSDPLVDACVGQAFEESSTCKGRTVENPILGPNGIITKVAQILVIFVGVASVIMIMVGGFKYMVSAGEAGATKSAKDTILYAVIGLVVAVMAQAIVSFVLRRL